MTVKREDLLAAAALGVVQYKQVDPILIFLLQRDVKLKRDGGPSKMTVSRKRGLYYIAALLAAAIVISLIAFYINVSFEALGGERFLWFCGLYVLFIVATIAWFEWRHVGVAVRIFATSSVALVPLAMFVSHQIHLV